MIKSQFPILKFELPENAGLLDINVFSQLTDEFKKLGAGNTPKARWFHQRRTEIIDALSKGSKLSRVLQTIRDIRVLVHLWSTDSTFFSTYPISKSHLKSIAKIKTPLSPSQLYSLIRLYFYQFNRISDLKFFCRFIRDNLSKICSKKRLSKDMALYCEHKAILFEPSLKAFWETYSPHESTLREFFQSYHIPWDHRAQFVVSSKHHLYIKPIENLRLGKVDPIFDVISKPVIKNMPYDDNFSIAQEVSMLMMDKAVNKNMPDNWRQFIIKLLGDPRMPKSSEFYQQGWAGLPVSYEQEMRKWLSQMDLLVFLDILQEIGKQTGNVMIRRMFPARKAFLESLHQTGMIASTRLFLSNDAVEFIEKRYDPDDRPSFAQISHKNKSVIYMQIGRVHLIEGTHNYSARLLDRLPSDHSINDLQKKKFMLPELATGLDQAYASEYKDSQHLYVVPHDIHNAWQRKLIEVFKTFDIHVQEV